MRILAVLDVAIDDIVRLRKPHPCGSTDWRVVRLGADIGLVCLGCGHRILMPRSILARRVKAFIQRGPRPTPEQLAAIRATEAADAAASADSQ
jgi:hypothetical protein